MEPNRLPQKSQYVIYDQRYKKELEQYVTVEYGPQLFPLLITWSNGQDILQKHRGIIGIRTSLQRLHEVESFYLRQDMMEQVGSTFAKLIAQKEYPQLQIEALLIVSMLCEGEQYLLVNVEEVIPSLLHLLSDGNPLIVRYCVCSLNKLADQIHFRNIILDQHGVSILLAYLKQSDKQLQVEKIMKILKKLSQGIIQLKKNLPIIEYICQSIAAEKYENENIVEAMISILADKLEQNQKEIYEYISSNDRIIPNLMGYFQLNEISTKQAPHYCGLYFYLLKIFRLLLQINLAQMSKRLVQVYFIKTVSIFLPKWQMSEHIVGFLLISKLLKLDFTFISQYVDFKEFTCFLIKQFECGLFDIRPITSILRICLQKEKSASFYRAFMEENFADKLVLKLMKEGNYDFIKDLLFCLTAILQLGEIHKKQQETNIFLPSIQDIEFYELLMKFQSNKSEQIQQLVSRICFCFLGQK